MSATNIINEIMSKILRYSNFNSLANLGRSSDSETKLYNEIIEPKEEEYIFFHLEDWKSSPIVTALKLKHMFDNEQWNEIILKIEGRYTTNKDGEYIFLDHISCHIDCNYIYYQTKHELNCNFSADNKLDGVYHLFSYLYKASSTYIYSLRIMNYDNGNVYGQLLDAYSEYDPKSRMDIFRINYHLFPKNSDIDIPSAVYTRYDYDILQKSIDDFWMENEHLKYNYLDGEPETILDISGVDIVESYDIAYIRVSGDTYPIYITKYIKGNPNYSSIIKIDIYGDSYHQISYYHISFKTMRDSMKKRNKDNYTFDENNNLISINLKNGIVLSNVVEKEISIYEDIDLFGGALKSLTI